MLRKTIHTSKTTTGQTNLGAKLSSPLINIHKADVRNTPEVIDTRLAMMIPIETLQAFLRMSTKNASRMRLTVTRV